MTTQPPAPLHIASDLHDRLEALAERQGISLEALAERVLAAHAEAEERALGEEVDDEARWQRYLESGEALPFDAVRRRVRDLARQAAGPPKPE